MKEECSCDEGVFLAVEAGGSEVELLCGKVRHELELKGNLATWPGSSRSHSTFKEMWESLADTNMDSMRSLFRSVPERPEGLLSLPDEQGRATLESAPWNRHGAGGQRLSRCGACLVVRLLKCHLRNGRSPIIVRTYSAKEFYLALGFQELTRLPGTFFIQRSRAELLILALARGRV